VDLTYWTGLPRCLGFCAEFVVSGLNLLDASSQVFGFCAVFGVSALNLLD
jgi:hypothetical protein